MRHLGASALRRLHDEPLALSPAARAHHAACRCCQRRAEAIAADADAVAALLAADAPVVDAEAALARLRLSAPTSPPGRHRRAAGPRLSIAAGSNRTGATFGRLRHATRAAAGATLPYDRGRRSQRAVCLVAAALLLTTLIWAGVPARAGSLAARFLTIFEPAQFIAVPLSAANLRALPDLSAYGTMRTISSLAPRSAFDAAEASGLSGLALRLPASLPAGIPRRAAYAVIGPDSASFTFSTARARAAMGSRTPLPPLPALLDGSTLRSTIGPVVVASYGKQPGTDSVPSLLIAQAPLPRVGSSGATVRQIEAYLIALPGLPPDLAASIRSISDPATTLPIPIPIDQATADRVRVHGTDALAIGDNTGVGSGVIWQQDGMVYGVAGTLTEREVLAIAASLRPLPAPRGTLP